MAAIKKGDTVVLVGTRKGLFLFHSRDRRRWQSRGPYFEGQTIRHAILDPRDGKTVYAGATSEHWGSTVARTTNFGGSWDLGKEGPRYSKESGLTVTRIWQIQPGAAGGLCLHTVLPYPGEPKRMLVGISSSGVFGTSDGGATWREMNGGVRKYEGGGSFEDGKIGTCPHKIVRDARDPAILYMQNHVGVYRRARGGPQWTVVEDGLPKIEKKGPASFGFPIAAHPPD